MNQPFNGQQARLGAIRSLIVNFWPDAFIETGTFIRSTTRFFSGNGVPVYIAELKRSFWFLSTLRLGSGSDAVLMRAEYVAILRWLAEVRPFERPLVYLDAHWWSDITVESELNILFDAWPDVLVIVGDFRVDSDPGYAYDDYKGVTLSLEDIMIPPATTAAFPALPAAEETGARRGTLYLARGNDVRRALGELVEECLLRALNVEQREPECAVP